MAKSLYIAEKPSVAKEFGKALHESLSNHNGYMEGDKTIVTWCVGHLVTMSYPEVYDEKLKSWRFDTLPFLPKEWKYEVIGAVSEQFKIVAKLLNREDVDTIYVCTDAGREGEYIYRLVQQMAGVKGKDERRVWIDSQTEEEILRGIREAKPLSEYNNLSAAAYLRAKEDYLMGINFSRILSLKYSRELAPLLNKDYMAISAGRVMTCVMGMVVRREREIRDFVKTPFYRVFGMANIEGATFPTEWKAVAGSRYENSPLLYKENGFKEMDSAIGLISDVTKRPKESVVLDENNSFAVSDIKGVVHKIEKKKEKKNPPLLYNLAELQNDCSKYFKISPDETLATVQELYEKKLVTYPRTDARVLSSAVAKEIDKNVRGLVKMSPYAQEILDKGLYKGIAKSRYTNDKQVTDHYAIIPTGAGLENFSGLSSRSKNVYEVILRRFLAIFFEAAEYQKCNLIIEVNGEYFSATDKYLDNEGYLKVMNYSFSKKKENAIASGDKSATEDADIEDNPEEENVDLSLILSKIKKGDVVDFNAFEVREGETTPPKRYNSGSIILAMENAGNLIEDEELRAQIKGSGIGTSATRAEILKKLFDKGYLSLNKKTQIITPSLCGEILYDTVNHSIPGLLNAELTASWEKGLTGVAEGTISEEEYMQKLEKYVADRTNKVKGLNNQSILRQSYNSVREYYKK